MIWVDETGEYTITGVSSSGSTLTSSSIVISELDASTYVVEIKEKYPNVTHSLNSMAANNGKYAIVANRYKSYDDIVAVDQSLVHSTPPTLTGSTYNGAGARCGNYVVFAGGSDNTITSGSSVGIASTDAYNTSLTHSRPTDLSLARYGIRSASLKDGSKGFFIGGVTPRSKVVDWYNSSLTLLTPLTMTALYSGTGSTYTDDGIICVGGYFNSGVESFSSNGTHSVLDPINDRIINPGAVHIGDYVVVAYGGQGSASNPYVANAFNSKTLTQIDLDDTDGIGRDATGFRVGKYGCIVHGYSQCSIMNAWNANLTRFDIEPWNSLYPIATEIGSYGVVCASTLVIYEETGIA